MTNQTSLWQKAMASLKELIGKSGPSGLTCNEKQAHRPEFIVRDNGEVVDIRGHRPLQKGFLPPEALSIGKATNPPTKRIHIADEGETAGASNTAYSGDKKATKIIIKEASPHSRLVRAAP